MFPRFPGVSLRVKRTLDSHGRPSKAPSKQAINERVFELRWNFLPVFACRQVKSVLGEFPSDRSRGVFRLPSAIRERGASYPHAARVRGNGVKVLRITATYGIAATLSCKQASYSCWASRGVPTWQLRVYLVCDVRSISRTVARNREETRYTYRLRAESQPQSLSCDLAKLRFLCLLLCVIVAGQRLAARSRDISDRSRKISLGSANPPRR